MTRKVEMIKELEASTSDFVTYGDGDLGIAVKKDDAIADIKSMDEDLIGPGTWCECDKDGNLI